MTCSKNSFPQNGGALTDRYGRSTPHALDYKTSFFLKKKKDYKTSRPDSCYWNIRCRWHIRTRKHVGANPRDHDQLDERATWGVARVLPQCHGPRPGSRRHACAGHGGSPPDLMEMRRCRSLSPCSVAIAPAPPHGYKIDGLFVRGLSISRLINSGH